MNYDEQEGSGGVGLLRGCLLFISSPFLASFVGIWVGVNHGNFNGIMSGIGTFILLTVLSLYIASKKGSITTLDCILPVIISIIASIVFLPLHLVSLSVFSVITCIASGFILSICLFLYRVKRINKAWLIIPAMSFMYECLPINLPSDIDDFLAVGGSTMCLVLGKTARVAIQGGEERQKIE